ncbi:MAG: NADPH-dependent glutamate synthase [Nitrospinae bacterium]|nr:NADPH-dependent glutamate synthase [Nitrospinota bacterium]MBI3814310.1 NADPH-dependent glutamate synthase [Nitrospinota bacterium]
MAEEKKEKKPKIPKIPRQPMPEQDPHERARNFNEVTCGFTGELSDNEALRCIQCKKPLCIDGCPVSINIPAFIKKVAEGDILGAAKVIKESNLLPAICGRVCPQEDQCEMLCVVGKKDKPVAIGRLERYVADYEAVHGKFEMPEMSPKTGKKVAIVGSGPAGLACAGDLIKWGHTVTIFEALHKAGGVLVYGIPEFRLPKAIVERELDYLKKIGVEFRLDHVIGRIRTVDELMQKDGYNVVFLANGAGLPQFMNIPGENLNGVYSANEFLTRSNLMKAYKFPEYDTPIKRFKNVAVIGGGNTAMDAVRTALRLGADNAYIIYRRSMAEMPARKEEIEHAGHEGVKFIMLTAPVRVIGNEKGWVTGLECIKMQLGEPDDSGRRRPVPIKESEFVVNLDAIIVAIGTNANPLVAQTTPGLDLNKWGYIVVDDEKTCRTSKKGIFAGGDIVTGAATVILAMGAGRSAAKYIDEYLKTL